MEETQITNKPTFERKGCDKNQHHQHHHLVICNHSIHFKFLPSYIDRGSIYIYKYPSHWHWPGELLCWPHPLGCQISDLWGGEWRLCCCPRVCWAGSSPGIKLSFRVQRAGQSSLTPSLTGMKCRLLLLIILLSVIIPTPGIRVTILALEEPWQANIICKVSRYRYNLNDSSHFHSIMISKTVMTLSKENSAVH